MTENATNAGLFAPTQQPQKASEPKSTEAAKPSEASTSQSKPRSQQDRIKSINELIHNSNSPQRGVSTAPERGGAEQDLSSAGDNASVDENSGTSPTVHDDIGAGTLSIKELAEQLGTSPKKLYDNIEITTGDGETLSLGEVKDRITTQEAATREIIERETAITERESAALYNMQTLDAVYSELKGKLSPELVQQLQKQTAEKDARERGLMLQAIPELADPTQLEAFRNDASEVMQAYGFRPNELVIRDHRIALAIRDLIQTKRQLKALMEFEPTQEPPKSRKPQGKKSRPNRNAETIANARGSKRPQDKAVAVNAILKGASNA